MNPSENRTEYISATDDWETSLGSGGFQYGFKSIGTCDIFG